MCQASNIGGTIRDISSVIVQEEPTPSKFLQIEFYHNIYNFVYPERDFSWPQPRGASTH